MTNKPMLSVGQELLEVCESALFRLETFIEADREMPIPSMEVLLDAFRRALAPKTAAQHQGLPVVLAQDCCGSCPGGCVINADRLNGVKP